ncbi:MAG: signal peptidase I [Candidatus Thiodiazotropha sp.]
MNSSPQRCARKPLLAMVASIAMPGLGQLYNGQATKGLVFAFLGLGLLVPVSAWIALHGPERLLWLSACIGVLITVCLYLYTIIDAFRTAKRIGENYTLQPFNRSYIYILVFIFGYFFVYNDLASYTRERLMESFWIPSQSMLPNILHGDLILADKRVNCLGCKYRVQRGDLAILISPNDRTKLYIKRIIGLPGDQIEIVQTQVRVNGQSIVKERLQSANDEGHITLLEHGDKGDYPVIWQQHSKHREDYALTVPNGHVYVLGDNRDAAHDSRFIGPIPLMDVVGKAKQIWLSYDREAGAVRWERVGLMVDSNREEDKRSGDEP